MPWSRRSRRRTGVSIAILWSLAGCGAAAFSSSLGAAEGAGEVEVGTPPADEYLVFPLPTTGPDESSQIQAIAPADPEASPFGWHDTDGDLDPDFTDTRGNNVSAQEDQDANNTGGTRADGGVGSPLEFFYPFDAAAQPGAGGNLEAAVTNLFYWTNILHDLAWHHGFDEAAGNFQTSNYSGQGLGGDEVQADALDGSGTNGALFATPPEGLSPRLQAFVWAPPPVLRVQQPPRLVGDVPAGPAEFGPPLDDHGVGGALELADDADDEGGAGTASDACQALVGFTPGRVAVVDRGACEFSTKVLNAQIAGATAVVVVNLAGDNTTTMGSGVDGDQVSIPSVLIGRSNGDRIKAALPVPGVEASLRLPTLIRRDSSFDSMVLIHEVGHGFSVRLSGGPGNSSCLSGTEQAGEGWSDFFALAWTARPEDDPASPRSIGSYVTYGSPSIRNFPYSTDLDVNPQTYGDIGSTNVPHGVGEVWASALWDLYWLLVADHGFDTDFYRGTGGNNLAVQLVMDGLKLHGCNPTFVTARDAILSADQVSHGGTNRCRIWQAFARRGIGVDAVAGSIQAGDEVESFDVPAECGAFFSDGFESGDTNAWSAVSP